jgi:hypothetical protein
MRIYHYTSIENLALILKNKKIRFNRLDKVDDLEEATHTSESITLSQYTFVSCWTSQKEENIPLWKMYAGRDMHGVRISLDSNMFKKYVIYERLFRGVEVKASKNGTESILPVEKFLTKDFIILPSINNPDLFLRPVKYVPNPSKEINDVAKIKEEIQLQTNKMGIFKHMRWAFQEEYRFVMIILPLGKLNLNELGTVTMRSLSNNLPPKIDYYDLELDVNALNDIEITLSPVCSESEKIIVEALANQFTSQTSIIQSELLGKIKQK